MPAADGLMAHDPLRIAAAAIGAPARLFFRRRVPR